MVRLTRIIIVAAIVTLVAGCRQESHIGSVGFVVNPETTPTMLTRDVKTLISDSGITRYQITTPLWLMYDEAKRPYWRFPNGLKLVKFDNYMHQVATVTCDSAIYFKQQQLWQLDGNIDISTVEKTRFRTNQLFWDQSTHKVYSDSFMRVERPDRTLEGYGFNANERLTSYEIRRVSGIFPASQLKTH